jgi:hypothetical protein
MPIDRGGGRRGSSGVLAMPGRRRSFRSSPLSTYHPVLTGVSRDATGAPLPGCVIKLFRTVDDVKLDETVSDGSGVYSFVTSAPGPLYLVFYKAGAPDVAGTTRNDLAPA